MVIDPFFVCYFFFFIIRDIKFCLSVAFFFINNVYIDYLLYKATSSSHLLGAMMISEERTGLMYCDQV